MKDICFLMIIDEEKYVYWNVIYNNQNSEKSLNVQLKGNDWIDFSLFMQY